MVFMLKQTVLLLALYTLLVTSTPSHSQNDVVTSQEEKPSYSAQGFWDRKNEVEIINDLGGDLKLEYHCKSKDDDLGYRILQPGKSWSFRFTPNFWGTTLFFCRFWWGSESHWFDIYIYKRDKLHKKNPCSTCQWMIRKSGPCRYRGKTDAFDICYPWNKDK